MLMTTFTMMMALIDYDDNDYDDCADDVDDED